MITWTESNITYDWWYDPQQLCSLTPWLAHQRGPSLFACPRVWSSVIVFLYFYTRGHQRAEWDISSRDFSVSRLFSFFEGISIVLEKIGLSKNTKNIQFEVFQESCPSSKIVCQGSLAEASTSVFLHVCLLIHAFDVNTYHFWKERFLLHCFF